MYTRQLDEREIKFYFLHPLSYCWASLLQQLIFALTSTGEKNVAKLKASQANMRVQSTSPV